MFFRPEFCLKLPSASTSRWRALLLANGWRSITPIRDLHPIVLYHARHTKKAPISKIRRHFLLFNYRFANSSKEVTPSKTKSLALSCRNLIPCFFNSSVSSSDERRSCDKNDFKLSLISKISKTAVRP